MKDKRIKCCPNTQCEHNQNRKKHRYCASDRFCSLCGNELVYVCAKCLNSIADDGPEHRVCAACEAKAEDRKDKVKKVGGGVATGAAALGAAARQFVKAGGVKKVADAAKKIMR